MAFIYLPAFEWLFKTVPLTLNELLLLLLISSPILFVVEVTKYLRRRKENDK